MAVFMVKYLLKVVHQTVARVGLLQLQPPHPISPRLLGLSSPEEPIIDYLQQLDVWRLIYKFAL